MMSSLRLSLGLLLVAALTAVSVAWAPRIQPIPKAPPLAPVADEEGAGCGAISLTVQPVGVGDDWRIIVTGAQGGYIIRGTSGAGSAPYPQFYGCDYLLGTSAGAVDSPVLYGDVVFVVYNYGPSQPTLYLQVLGVGETSGLGQLN